MMGEVSVLTGIDVNPYISAFRGIYGITSILEKYVLPYNKSVKLNHMKEKSHIYNAVEYNDDHYVVFSDYEPITNQTAKNALINFLDTSKCTYHFFYVKCESKEDAVITKERMFNRTMKERNDSNDAHRKDVHNSMFSMIAGVVIAMLFLGFLSSIVSAIFRN